MRRWIVSLVLVLVTLTGWTGRSAAGDAAPAPWQAGSAEVQGEKTFLKIYLNNFGTLWSEFSKSQLYKSFAQDPAVAANSTKFVDKMDARLKAFSKAVGQDDDMFLLNQIGKIGPVITGWELSANRGMPLTVVDFKHTCDPAFVEQLNRYLLMVGDPRLAQIFNEDFKFEKTAFAHREIKGHVAASTTFGAKLLSSADHFVLFGSDLTENEMFKRFAQKPDADGREADFTAFMGKKSNWLSAMRLDLPMLFKSLPAEAGEHEADFKAVLGAISVVSMKEQLNKSNRFDMELTYPGQDLNKGLLFYGAGSPVNNEIAQIYPDELIFIAHLNYDFHKLLTTDFKNMAEVSAEFKKELERMQTSAKELVTSSAGEGQPAIPGPVLTHGVSLLMLESDKLEDIGKGFVFVVGIEPGFKVNETWAGGLKMAQGWNNEKKPVKTVTYNGTDIIVLGDADHGSQGCLAIVGGALIAGENLKQVKRVVRYLNKVQAGEIDPKKGNETSHLDTLVTTDGGGTLYGSVLIKMDYLIKTLLPTGIGAGAMMFPDLPTNVDWNAVAGRLQPATCVLLYDPQKGFKARMISDFPLPTLAAGAATTGAFGMMQDFGRFFGGGQGGGEDDLPPVNGPVVDEPNGPDGVEVKPEPDAVPPAPEIVPPAPPAP